MADKERKEIKYEIIEHVADLIDPNKPDKDGWIKEVNIMTWGNYKKPVIDIRSWKRSEDGTVEMGKGISLSIEQLRTIQKINLDFLSRYFKEEENQKKS